MIDFEIQPDNSDPRNLTDLLERIDGALRNSNSILRSGASGFLLDGATLEFPPTDVPPSTLNQVGQVFPIFQSNVGTEDIGQDLAPRQPPLSVQKIPENTDSQRPSTDALLERIVELSTSVEDLKSIRAKLETETEELKRSLVEAEQTIKDQIKQLDERSVLLESAQRERLLATQDAQDARKSLAHAKEMWMKESSRATAIRDQLDKAELALADNQKELRKLQQRSKDTETENFNLKHLISKSNDIVSTQVLTPSAVANSFSASDSYFVRGGTMASLRGNPLGTVRGIESAHKPHRDFGVTVQGGIRPTSSKYLQLSVSNDGILFEDDTIQIGIKARFAGLGEGVLGVYFGNKTSGILQNFQTKYSLDNCGPHLHLTTAPLPSQLGPKNQVCQRVAAQITGSFSDSPGLAVSFLLPDNTPRTVALKLPVTLNKFMQGRDLTRDEFFSNWRQQGFMLSEASCVIHVAMNLVQIARTSQLGGALTLHHQVDDVSDNLVLAGQFPSDSEDGIRCATIPEALVLCRIEVGSGSNLGQARIAVRSNDPAVADAVRLCLSNQLSTNLAV